MEGSPRRREQLAMMRKELFDQGYVDDQFIELEELQDDDNPNFVEEVVTLFFTESARILQNISQILEKPPPLDTCKLDSFLHQFKSSCSSIGANRVTIECTQFRDACKPGNKEGHRRGRSFQQLMKEYMTLKKKLEAYFELARQTGQSSGTACMSSPK